MARRHSGRSGQIVVEYTLLLMTGVVIAMLITTFLVSRDPNSPGLLIQRWAQINETIGADKADDL